jgi:hypothetical protein
MAGDFNNDGLVNNADLAVWKAAFAVGTMSGADYLDWQRNYGANSATAVAAAIPEPGAVYLAVVAAMALRSAARATARPRHA